MVSTIQISRDGVSIAILLNDEVMTALSNIQIKQKQLEQQTDGFTKLIKPSVCFFCQQIYGAFQLHIF